MAFIAYQKLYNEWLTFGKLLLLNPAKTLYSYLRTWNTIPSFFAPFYKQNHILIRIQSLILSTDRPKQTIALSLKKQTTTILMYFFHYSFFNLLNMLRYSKNEVIIQWTTHNNREKESTYSWHCFDLRKSTKGRLHLGRWWKTVINDDLDFVADEMTRYLSSDTTIPFHSHNQRKYMNCYESFCKFTFRLINIIDLLFLIYEIRFY